MAPAPPARWKRAGGGRGPDGLSFLSARGAGPRSGPAMRPGPKAPSVAGPGTVHPRCGQSLVGLRGVFLMKQDRRSGGAEVLGFPGSTVPWALRLPLWGFPFSSVPPPPASSVLLLPRPRLPRPLPSRPPAAPIPGPRIPPPPATSAFTSRLSVPSPAPRTLLPGSVPADPNAARRSP